MGGAAEWADQESLELGVPRDLEATLESQDLREIWDYRDLKDCLDLQELKDCEEGRVPLGRLVPWVQGVNMEFKDQPVDLDRRDTEAAEDGRDQKDKGGSPALLE